MLHTSLNTGRLLAVSDIHGHAGGLLQLLDTAEYNPASDRLILVGDYIDEDPPSWETLHLIRRLTEEGALAVPGNMELRLPGQLADIASGASGGTSLREWLRGLPPYIEADGYLFVHAGFRPDVTLVEQTLQDMTEIREEFWRVQPPSYAGKGIIFGHTPTFKMGAKAGEVWRKPGLTGIDTGAKHNCRLTLLDVHNALAYSCSTEATRQHYKDFKMEVLEDR
ncbi:diadenosine tetraphosphatase [compost metagenome]